MIIFGEKINTINKKVARALKEKDAGFLQRLALRQAEAGVDVLGVNVGMDLELEPGMMRWAMEVVQEVTDKPIAIDSPYPETIRAGLEACRNPQAAVANSITHERHRVEGVLPLVKEYGCSLVALPIDENGIPPAAQGRLEVAKRLMDIIASYDIQPDRVYLDCITEPVSVSPDRALIALDTVRAMKGAFPEARIITSITGISFGLPRRRVLHWAYLPLLVREGIDALILDPLDRRLMAALRAVEVLMNEDENCARFIEAYRRGALEV